MKKSDFSPEELDELLVAFADNELDGDQKKFIEELISSDAEVKKQFLEFKKSGEMLKALFDVEGVSTPEHVKQEIMNYAIATKPNKFIRFTGKIKKAVNDNFRIQNITQIAAALVVGAFFGPSLFESDVQLDPNEKLPLKFREVVGVGIKNSSNEKLPLNLRGLESIKIEGFNHGSDIVSIFVSSDNSKFDVLIASGEKIKKDQQFTIHVLSPVDGEAIIYEEIERGLDNSLGGIEKNILFQDSMLEGQSIILPQQGAYSLDNQNSFIIVGEFSNNSEKQYFRSVYKVE